MSRDDIIRMAREAGFVDASFCRWSAYTDDLERFAALVAALAAAQPAPTCPHIRSSGPADRATHWCALAANPPAAPEPEPVATVTSETGADISMSWWHAPALPVGTKLYTAPPAAPSVPASQWIACSEQLPESGVTVLACYVNDHGKTRRIRAEWVAAKTREGNGEGDDLDLVYDEDADMLFWPEGWYEQIDNWPEYTAIVVNEGEITHWMDLPAAPSGEEK